MDDQGRPAIGTKVTVQTQAPASSPAVCAICDRPTGSGVPWRIYETRVCRPCHKAFLRRRALAFLIDSWMAGIIIWCVQSLAWISNQPPIWQEGIIEGAMLGFLLLIKDSIRGTSPGKWFLDLRVIDDHTSEPIGLARSCMRNLPFAVPALNIVTIGLAISQLMDNDGRRIGDGWARTRVVWRKHAERSSYNPELRCPSCEYCLVGNRSGICPECGAPVPEHLRRRIQQ